MNCPNCNSPMVLFTGYWRCRKCGAKKPFEVEFKIQLSKEETKGEE